MYRLLNISVVLLCLFVCCPAESRVNISSSELNECKKIVADVNSLTFRKVYLYGYSNSATENIIWQLSDHSGFDDQSIVIYLDDRNRIRKCIEACFSEYGSSVNIHYYDTLGHLCYSIISESRDGDFEISGYIYNVGNKIILSEIRDMKYRYSEDGTSNHLITYKTYSDGILSDLPKVITLPTTITALMSTFGLPASVIKIPNNCPMVRFVTGAIGVTYVNRNDVRLRTGSGHEYPVAYKVNAGFPISIIRMGKQEKLKCLGAHNWYQIGDEYIFGAFLEPVEQIITE